MNTTCFILPHVQILKKVSDVYRIFNYNDVDSLHRGEGGIQQLLPLGALFIFKRMEMQSKVSIVVSTFLTNSR